MSPALVLCFIGLVPIVLAYNEMQGREQALVKFRGNRAIDPSIVAGIEKHYSGGDLRPSGPSPPRRTLQIPPWTCRFRYPIREIPRTLDAFAYGGSQTRIAGVVGGFDDRTFDLSIAP